MTIVIVFSRRSPDHADTFKAFKKNRRFLKTNVFFCFQSCSLHDSYVLKNFCDYCGCILSQIARSR